MFKSTSTVDIDACANCGKSEERNGDLKACNGCKLVKYCNRECQLAHRKQHKTACKKRAAELHEEALFKERPRDKCPVCDLPMLFGNKVSVFESCCGKNVCIGCDGVKQSVDHKLKREEGEEKLCPICETPASRSDEDGMERVKTQAEMGNAHAIYMLGVEYAEGRLVTQDVAKAHELWLKAGKLGCSDAYNELGNAYFNGEGVEEDKKKAKHYYELSAIMGDVAARYFLGLLEGRASSDAKEEFDLNAALQHHDRATKHFILAARAGKEEAMDQVKELYKRQAMLKSISDEEYANTILRYEKSRDEMKSDDRETALAIRDMFWGRKEN